MQMKGSTLGKFSHYVRSIDDLEVARDSRNRRKLLEDCEVGVLLHMELIHLVHLIMDLSHYCFVT